VTRDEAFIRLAAAADDLIEAAAVDMAGMGLQGATFRRDMEGALSGDPLVPFTVRDVLAAIHNWADMVAPKGEGK
jgi:hypothetical protein